VENASVFIPTNHDHPPSSSVVRFAIEFPELLEMLTQASLVAPRRSESNPPIIPLVLDSILFSLHPCPPLVVSHLRIILDWPQQRRKLLVLSSH